MKKKIMAGLLATSLLFATACGKKQQGVTDKTVKVGNTIATEGAFAAVGVPFKSGIEAYFKMVNDNGGINGRKIEYIHQNDDFDPAKGKAAVEKLVKDDKVFALVGHFGTPVVGATLDDLRDYGIPTVYFATGLGALYNENAQGKERNLYPVQPVYPAEGRVLAARATGTLGAEPAKIGVIFTNDDAGKDLLAGVEKEITVAAKEQVAPGSEDVSAAVQKVLSKDVDVVIVAAIQATFPNIVKEINKQATKKIDILTTYVNVSDSISNTLKNDLERVNVYGNAWIDFNTAQVPVYQEWIQKVSKEDYSANTFAMTGWVAGHFFVEGLRNVNGDLTWESYMSALESKPVRNPFGGAVDFSNGKRLGTTEMQMTILDPNSKSGWSVKDDFKSLDTLLGK